MKIITYIKENGIKHTIDIFYEYKLDIIIQKILGLFLRKVPLKDIIVIESHNDFDCNGGAFYDYLIANHYNDKIKIVWLLKHPSNAKLPKNVISVPLHKPSFKKQYYRWVAKWFTCDNDCSGKLRSEQKVFYFGHGGFGLKNCKGFIILPDNIDYIAMPSHYLSDVFADQLMLSPSDPRLCYIGFPYVDIFYSNEVGDLHKITSTIYKKVFLWMPTFRKGGGNQRQDSTIISKLGIPLIKDFDEYEKLNSFLNDINSFLIIKIHPMQDLSDLRVTNKSNIAILTGEDVKEINVDNYRLMKDCDALISDYSSAGYDFLQCNKPIAYDFSDLSNYKLGLSVSNPEDFMAGHLIKSFDDMMIFMNDVIENKDPYYNKRQTLRNKIFDYYDGNNCRRAVELLEIK